MVTALVVVGSMVVSALVVGCSKAMHTPMRKMVRNPYSRKVSALWVMEAK